MRKNYSLRWIFVYPLSSAIQQIIIFALLYQFNMSVIKVSHLEIVSEKFFLIIEFVSLAIVFANTSEIKRHRRSIRIITALYLVSTLTTHLIDRSIYKFNISLIYIHSFLILSMAIINLIDIFKSPPRHKLLELPNFWIIIGVMLYFLCTLPIYIGHDFLFSNDDFIIEFSLYSINYICYSALYLFIIRALICKRVEN